MGIAGIFRATAFLAPPLAIIAPLSTAPLLALATLGVIGLWIWDRRALPRMPRTPLLIVAAFLIWGAISLLWTTAPGYGLFAVARLSFMLLGGVALAAIAARLPASDRRRTGRALIAGVLAALLILALNVYLSGIANRTLALAFDLPAYEPYHMNRPATLVAIFLWPAALAVATTVGAELSAALMIAGLAIIAGSESATAAIAVLAGSMALAGVIAGAAVAVRRAVAFLLVAALLAGPLYVHGPALTSKAAVASMLPSSLHHRIYIWRFAAEKIREKPVVGWGLEASRSIPGGDVAQPIPLRGEDGSVRLDRLRMALLPLHPHNAGLQIWLELGIAGVVLLASLILCLIRSIGRRSPPRAAAAFCLGQIVCVFLIAQSSYGIWQSWWLSAIVLGAAFSIALLPRDPDPADDGARLLQPEGPAAPPTSRR